MIADASAGTAGLVVDEVNEVLTVDSDRLDPVPGSDKDFIEGVVIIGQRLVILLDPDTMLDGVTVRRR